MSIEEDKITITEAFIGGINVCNIELFGLMKEHLEKLGTIYPLVEFIVERLSTVTDLARAGNNWDAEIIYRSALEALIKFVYITSAAEEESDARLREFWEDLGEINAIKMSEQAKKALKIGENYKSETYNMIFRPLVLSEEREQELRRKWPVSKRKAIERKWSFSEIVIAMATGSLSGKTDDKIAGLAHNYRYASHVTHADETGIQIIRERRSRSPEFRELGDLAHFIRLLSDSFFFCVVMGIQISSYVKQNPKFFIELIASIKEISDLSDNYMRKLQNDQSYDKFR